jgi:hypothetical protein
MLRGFHADHDPRLKITKSDRKTISCRQKQPIHCAYAKRPVPRNFLTSRTDERRAGGTNAAGMKTYLRTELILAMACLARPVISSQEALSMRSLGASQEPRWYLDKVVRHKALRGKT